MGVHRPRLWLCLVFIVHVAVNSCGGSSRAPERAATSPAAPTTATGAAPATAVAESLVSRPNDVAFPPRNEPVNFGTRLETKYRDQLRRTPEVSFVNLEGYVVWIQEYLRYRVNGCDHATAMQRVFTQIDVSGVIPVVCGSPPSGDVSFPPRNEPFEFGNRLNEKYRDQLRRNAETSFVNLEGYIVWIQEYLRYRVNSCSHEEAVQRVFAQVDGGPVQATCQPTPTPTPAPCAFALSSTTQNIAPGGASQTVNVTASSNTCSWTAVASSGAPAWITITGGAAGTGSGTIAYTAAPNNTAAARTGTITAQGTTGGSATLTLNQTSNVSPTLTAAFQLFDLTRTNAATTRCDIHGVDPAATTTCTLDASASSSSLPITSYNWTVTYTYRGAVTKALTTGPRVTFTETCDETDGFQAGNARTMTVQLTIRNSAGSQATVTSGSGSQPGLQIVTFT